MSNYPIFDVLKRARDRLQSNNDEASTQLASDIQALIDAESLQSVIGFDPETQIAIIWDVEDVAEVRPGLTDEQAVGVLRLAKKHHDATTGVNWEVLDRWSDFFLKRENTLTSSA
jgi:hypothetical protein